MLFSAHVADTGAMKALGRRTPKPAAVPGLLSARTGICGPFGPHLLPRPQFRREAMLACWEDEASLDDFLAEDRTGKAFASGWTVRMRLFRSVGIWPGVDEEMGKIAAETPTPKSGPTVAITIGTFYLRTLRSFLQANRAIEEQFLSAPGAFWGSGFANVPQRLLGTLTVWNDPSAAEAYMRSSAHSDAVRDHFDPQKDPTGHTFVTGGGFFGFQPISVTGSFDGKNPLPPGLSLATSS